MWKYVTRRVRDTFERGANHLDKRHSVVINSSKNHVQEENKNANPPCCWFRAGKCWNSFGSENDTNNKKRNFEQLNRTWFGAITWSSALVFGWYASKLLHLKYKNQLKGDKISCLPKISYLLDILPCLSTNHSPKPLTLPPVLEESFKNLPSSIHLVSNDHSEGNAKDVSNSTNSVENSDDDLGAVLNSIENRLGLAAIENGHHQDGLNLLRSAANRNYAPALYNLGLCYELGLGLDTDEKMAMELYRSAAALQHPGALYNLGIYYGQGRGGLTCDRVTATRLLRLAAVQGQEDAITALTSLEDQPESPADHEMGTWTKQFSSFTKPDHIFPTHSALFVQHVSELNMTNYTFEPLVY